MSRRYVEQFRDGDSFEEVYLVAEKQLKVNKKGDTYLQVDLCDRTGRITARMWNTGDSVFRGFENGDYLLVEGKVQLFQGTLQVILTHLEKAEPKSIDVKEFLPRTEQDIAKLTLRLRTWLLNLTNPHLRALGEQFLGDAEFMAGFTACPAGVRMHHAYVGGLLEHTVTMMDIADRLAPIYPGVDRELLLVGIFLHDMGKTRELSYATAFGYTDEGQLIGHIPIALEMLVTMANHVPELTGEPMPKELLARLRHMIISHHGTLEHGSPKIPMTPEAELLHLIDTLDTRMHQTLREIRDDQNNPTAWTAYSPAAGRKIFKGGAYGPTDFGDVKN